MFVVGYSPVYATSLLDPAGASHKHSDVYSSYELRAGSIFPDSNAQDELQRIERRLKYSGWKTYGSMQDTTPNKGDVLPLDSSRVGELERMLKVVPNGIPLREYRRTSSVFGKRFHPILKKYRAHNGIDFSVPSGTPILNTANGIVVVAAHGGQSAFGKYVVVKHPQGFTTLYAHLRKVNVQPGEFIAKGSMLGESGSTGQSTGPHLHYEIRYQDQVLDPQPFVEWSSSNYHALFTQEKKVPWSVIRQQNTSLSQLDVDKRSVRTFQ